MNEMNQPMVSVVMPVYNAARFLKQAIDSVLSQTYQNIELILVDDCSTDDSMQIMRDYSNKDARIKLFCSRINQGVAKSRNIGVQAAKGEYIALLDSDDLWEKTKLEKQIKSMTESNAAISYCSVNLIDEHNRIIKPFIVPKTTNYNEMLVRCFFICSTVVIQANLLKAHPFRADYYHEDYLLWTELLALNVKAVGETEVLAYYRQLAGSRSHQKLIAAKNRWKIYRTALGMSFWQSGITFVKYAMWGIVKYYL